MTTKNEEYGSLARVGSSALVGTVATGVIHHKKWDDGVTLAEVGIAGATWFGLFLLLWASLATAKLARDARNSSRDTKE
jgi:hypothetical protein